MGVLDCLSVLLRVYKSESCHFWKIQIFDLMLQIIPPGRKPEEEGVEDNGLEENSGDGQVCESHR